MMGEIRTWFDRDEYIAVLKKEVQVLKTRFNPNEEGTGHYNTAIGVLENRIEEIGYQITLTDSAKEFLAEKGFDPEFGARPLQRALQKYLEEPLAEKVLQGLLKEGEELKVDYTSGNEELTIGAAKAIKAPKTKKEIKE